MMAQAFCVVCSAAVVQEEMMSESKVRTSLVVMAAGIGSRFGQGIKQLTSFGPAGEIIMDYSIYDALHAGFDRIVFVIRKDLEADFREVIGRRIEKQADTAYVFQEKDDLPDGFTCPPDRKKPWGTGQAILACRGVVREPFCVINADDYYGRQAFGQIHDWLTAAHLAQEKPQVHQICMSGFVLANTLSDHGGVTRGVCSVDAQGRLTGVNETKGIVRCQGGCAATDESGHLHPLDPCSLVSMNMWGFAPEFLEVLEDGFVSFLQKNIGTKEETTAEFLLPIIVDDMLRSKTAQVSVLPTQDKWFGVTYQEDIPSVKESFLALTKEGIYPENLWSS